MRKTLLAATTAFVVGGIAAGSVLSQAQPTPPGPPMEHRGMTGRHDGADHGRPFTPGDFALIYRQPDRQLAPADVQKIAEGFLLWNGNHSWKVTNVTAAPDGPIGFNLETPEGSLVAKFTMDPHTGRIALVG
jgi:hypothetical protein